MPARVTLLLFLVLVVGGGMLIGWISVPGAWYAALEKPWFSPPNWLFGPVWMILYILIAIAGWRIWRREPSGGAMKLWWLQLALNFLWPPVFFGMQAIGFAVAVILSLLAVIVGFIAMAWHRDRPAALLFIPYALWVAFASALNGYIDLLN